MRDFKHRIKIEYTNKAINDFINELSGRKGSYTKHFNHIEEFFIKFEQSFSVPSLKIHHNVEDSIPEQEYISSLKKILRQIIRLAPDIFTGLTYFFQPSRILKPAFFRIYRVENYYYIYILELDLLYRARMHEVINRGTNDTTAEYKSRILFLNADFIPVEKQEEWKLPFTLEVFQTLSDTWIGEYGRGYLTRGVWMDDELTKFFTKLLLAPNLKHYPYYPFQCQYKTLCQSLINLSAAEREHHLLFMHRALVYLLPVMLKIQEDIKSSNFSQDLPIFQSLKARLDVSWNNYMQNLKINRYLNRNDMTEYEIELQNS